MGLHKAHGSFPKMDANLLRVCRVLRPKLGAISEVSPRPENQLEQIDIGVT